MVGKIHFKYRTPSLHHWSKAGMIPGALTSSAPATAGYWYSQGRDHPGWTTPAQVPTAATLTAPAVSVPTVNSVGPLLLVYKAPFSSNVRYQTLTGTTWSGVLTVPRAATNVARSLMRNVLGITTPGSLGNIVLRHYG